MNFTATYNPERPNSVTLQWSSLLPEHQNGIVTGYALTSVPSNGLEEPQDVILKPNLVSFELTNLIPDTQYDVSISAITIAGRGPTSNAQVTVLPNGNYIIMESQLGNLRKGRTDSVKHTFLVIIIEDF